jgi:tryptophan halogenase
MAEKVRSAVIVGGGTAGWMAGLALGRRLLNAADCKVSVVESPDVPSIGVGESTVPHLRFTLHALGLDENEFMRRTGATFKLGVRFVNWADLTPGDMYWAVFSPYPTPADFAQSIKAYLLKLDGGEHERFDYSGSGFVNAWLSERAKAPKFGTEEPYRGQVNYAYHLDAIRLAELLREKSVNAGVTHIQDTVVDTVVDERGFIRSLRTRGGRELTADLFIDCTGFRGLLINRALKEPFISYGSHLLCDRTLALPLPTDPTSSRVASYTTATAASHGWIFEIPLFHRRGIGYVYSSAFVSDDDAEQELRRYLGIGSNGGRSPRRIDMRVGRTRCAWVGNCVSLGLAAGFTDPLHATSILLVERGLYFLDMYFPDREFAPALAEVYNRKIAEGFEATLEFIFLHYFASPRRDTPFWRAATAAPTPGGAGELLELWDRLTFETGPLATPISHIAWSFGIFAVPNMLLGVGRLPKRALETVRCAAPPPTGNDAVSLVGVGHRLASLPDHAAYLALLNDGTLDEFCELLSRRSSHRLQARSAGFSSRATGSVPGRALFS